MLEINDDLTPEDAEATSLEATSNNSLATTIAVGAVAIIGSFITGALVQRRAFVRTAKKLQSDWDEAHEELNENPEPKK